MSDRPRSLCGHEALLALPGLGTGRIATTLGNPRMAFAAHVGGVMNGLLPLALAPASPRVTPDSGAASLACRAGLGAAHARRAAAAPIVSIAQRDGRSSRR